MAEPENSHYNKLTFQKKEYYNTKNDPKSFLNKKSTVQKYITELDKLNDLSVANDSLSTLKIADFLKDNLSTPQAIEPLEKSKASIPSVVKQKKKLIIKPSKIIT